MSERPPPLRESLRIPGRGRLELRIDEGRVLFVSESGRSTQYRAHPILAEPGALSHATARDGRSALLARARSDRLHWFDADRLEFRRVEGFERLKHAEELRLHALATGFLVVTENGIASLDARGVERWRIEGVTTGWRVLETVENVVWLRDVSGNVVGFDERTGVETAC